MNLHSPKLTQKKLKDVILKTDRLEDSFFFFYRTSFQAILSFSDDSLVHHTSSGFSGGFGSLFFSVVFIFFGECVYSICYLGAPRKNPKPPGPPKPLKLIVSEVSGVALLLLLLGLLVGPIIFFSAWNTFMPLGSNRFPRFPPPLLAIFYVNLLRSWKTG